MLLSHDIRTWVLVPLTIVLVLVGVLRHYLVVLIQSAPKRTPRAELVQQRRLARGAYLRTNGVHLPPLDEAWRRKELIDELEVPKEEEERKEGDGENAEKTPAPTLPPGMEMDGMMEGMKRQMVSFVPQTVIMGWINYFFSGFVLIRLPFPLTVGFKPMLQRGIETAEMDVTWVSSLSLYFLALFGLNPLFRLMLGDDSDPIRDMHNTQMPQTATRPDYRKLYTAERENLNMKTGTWTGIGVEERVILACR